MKSIAEMTRLVKFLKSDDFKKEDLDDFDIRAETAKFDRYLEKSGTYEPAQAASGSNPPVDGPHDGWRESDVVIKVPDGKTHSVDDIPTFTVPGLHHRSLVEVIKATIEDSASKMFHYTPFKSLYKDSEGDEQRIYDELYSSNAMIDAHMDLQQQRQELGCDLERVVASVMLWSDSTHLASFGTASLWPVYLFFGNQSKYTRGKPSTGSCHHVAYIPKLPDSFYDYYVELTGEGPPPDVLTHCRRELMHSVWQCLLDDSFLEAYDHGIVIRCPDGIDRRFYPRIFTYSADYPEKVLLATIRNMGNHPCPQCLIPKTRIPELGSRFDARRRELARRVDNDHLHFCINLARQFIYEKGLGVKSAAVERLLAERSLVPTSNAFSCLSKFGFNIFNALVPDFMHEFELGVWKATFTHLLRILFEQGGNAIPNLNQRYRDTPTFGRSTIRRFSDNVSAMKKLAARNFEDLLQCAIPVFDGLLEEEHNDAVLDLLFTLAEWHCLGKLRLHTDTTIGWLDQCTTNLGQQLRQFQKHTCSSFNTKELPKEEAARRRRKKSSTNTSAANPSQAKTSQSEGQKKKGFSLILYKLHALGNYVRNIKLFGTSDSYSTQPGELEHRRVKKFYVRTNKNHAVRQMTRLERREHAIRRQLRRLAKANTGTASSSTSTSAEKTPRRKKQPKSAAKSTPRLTVGFNESESLPYTPPEYHHHISSSRNFPIHIHSFLDSTRSDDPAIKDYYSKLQDHLIERILHPDIASDGVQYPPSKRANMWIVNDRMYRHKVMRINYTTYDMRQAQDSINARNHADVMILSRNDPDHPFEYARVIGIFHVDVILNDSDSDQQQRPISKEVLWVRWFRRDTSYRAGFRRKRLHRLQFLPSDDTNAFSFLDPDDVIRGAHLIPAFRFGPTEELLEGESFGRAEGELDDWHFFYVNIFVDRDMYMRYAGKGIGHYRLDTGDVTPAQPVDAEEPEAPQEPELLVVAGAPVNEDRESATGDQTDSEMGVNGNGEEEPEEQGDEEEDEDEEEAEEDEDEEDEEGGEEAALSEEDFGAEDGEGGFMDGEDDEGYDVL